MVFNPISFGFFSVLLLAVFLTASYFWFEYSDRINLMLAGEVYTRTAGIYSSPKTLRQGERITPSGLISYLKQAGYVSKSQKADPQRSRYELRGAKIAIEPGEAAVLDGKREFRKIVVRFDKTKKTVSSIVDSSSGEELSRTALEPLILSSIAAEGDGRRRVVSFQDLPPSLVNAITVTEDRAFFDHYGVNFRGIARALWRRYDGEDDGSVIENQGGSSITQQLVKNLFLTPERSFERKAKEAYMSVILETRLTKKEIFTLYVNQIYLGQNGGVSIYGVGEASNIYFGKDVSALSLEESAFIAGIIRSPNRYDPRKNSAKVRARRNQVLESMAEASVISHREMAAAKARDLRIRNSRAGNDSGGIQYFSQYAVQQVPKLVTDPEALQHLRVYTTIDPDLQRAAYKAVSSRLRRLESRFKPGKRENLNAALVAIRPRTGEIIAMIGGKDYSKNQFNRAVDAKRQPGSVFKPFVYAAAINTAYQPNTRVLTAASVFMDERKVFTFNQDSYSPNNYGSSFTNKEMTLRDALVKSKNVITVDVAMELNIGNVMNLARKAGLPRVERSYPSMALGTAEATPLQIAEAYSTFANLGERSVPMAIRKITTGDGRTVVEPRPSRKGVLRPDVAYILNDMMKDVVNRGTAAGVRARGFRNVDGKKAIAGKTGTSRDGWFVGFTPEIVCAVYVGFDDGSDLGLTGAASAMPIWADFMRDALAFHPEWNGDWKMPSSIEEAEIDVRNGKVLGSGDVEEDSDGAGELTKIDTNDTANEESDPDENGEEPVPREFRRTELFIMGTVPNLTLPSEDERGNEGDSDGTDPGPSGTPFTTWEEALESKKGKNDKSGAARERVASETTIDYCPVSGKRVTAFCPDARKKTFRAGTEPKEFCDVHTSSDN